MTAASPRFAVVGCVNMGKSSLVATLTEQDWIPIDRRPGTTVAADTYNLTVDNTTVLSLIDTPGFQNARRALAWVEQWLDDHAGDNPTPAQAIRAFVATHETVAAFANEVRLLQPILDGAGIVYVVNGGKPYQHRYAAEMQLLSMTGRPRMGVINLIDGAEPESSWHEALAAWFKVARFDAVHAGPDERLALLRSFAGVDDAWAVQVDAAVDALEQEWQRRRASVADLISTCLVECLTMVVTAPTGEGAADPRPRLVKELGDKLRQAEQRLRRAVEERCRHTRLERKEVALPLIDADLLDREAWKLLGLSNYQIVAAGTTAGAAMGGIIDFGVGGLSFLAGTVVGAAIGGVGSLTTAWSLSDARLFGIRAGGKEVEVAPPKDVQFPFVLLDRALIHWQAVRNRSHARQDLIELPDSDQAGLVGTFSGDRRKELATVFGRLRAAAGGSVDDADRKRLTAAITAIIEELQAT